MTLVTFRELTCGLWKKHMKRLDRKGEHVPKGESIFCTCALNVTEVKRRKKFSDAPRAMKAAKDINVADR